MKRLLITGSRSWKDIDKVFIELTKFYEENGPFVLVHGACKDGADHFAVEWYESLFDDEKYGIVIEPHAADWLPNGRNGQRDLGAGLKRNTLMVSLGADMCYAFPTICHKKQSNCPKEPHYSHGTAHCMKLVQKANIPLRNFGPSLA